MFDLEGGAHVLIAGVSVRALAASASRAGYRVTAIDAFGDVDLRALAEVLVLRRDGGTPYSAPAAASVARAVKAAAAAYTANFENYPDAIRRLAESRHLLGNPPEVVARVRQPVVLMHALHRLGFAVPRTRASAPPPEQTRRWLVKPRRSGGGHATRPWRRGAAVGRCAYVQERILGVPGSITFAADGRRAVPLGVSRQLVGEAAFGAQGFRYCGSLVSGPRVPLFEQEDRVRDITAALVNAVTAEFGLVGVNGIDFVVRDGVPYPIEVNPRYSASMELIERRHGISIFEMHARACAGELPQQPLWNEPSGAVHGKAIIFARHNVRLGDTTKWLDDEHADVPYTGEQIPRGHPICTVFAHERNVDACYDSLKRRAAAVLALATTKRNTVRRNAVRRGVA